MSILNDEGRASTLTVTNTAAAGTGVTLTLPSASGLFHYITEIQIVKFAAALLVAAATPVLVTTTDITGSPIFSFQADAAAQGLSQEQKFEPTTPLKSATVNTATTIVCPATTNVIWRVNVFYFTAP